MKQILILGGGIAGLSAARALEKGGAFVHLVEKEERLGGKALDWACMATDECQNCGACLSGEMVAHVEHLENARVYLNTELGEIRREKGQFQATLKGAHAEAINADAIVIATGFEPFDPAAIEPLRYARNDKVITTRDLNRILKHEELSNLFDPLDSPRIAFIQCVGSRNREQGRDYCSQICCKVAIRQANKILDQYPHADISIFHMDLQIIGKEFRHQFSRLEDRVKLVQGVPGEILTDHNPGRLTIVQEDEENGERTAYDFDVVVLAVGMGSPSESQGLFALLNIKADQWGFLGHKVTCLGHGIYSAGAAKEPMDILSAKQSGMVAAHSVAQDLGLLPNSGHSPSVVIVGNGTEGTKIARAMGSRGFEVKLIDFGSHEMDTESPFEYLPDSRISKVTRIQEHFELLIHSNGQTRSIHADALIVASEVRLESKRIEGLGHEVMGLTPFEKQWRRSEQKIPARITFLLDHRGEEWKHNARCAVNLASNLAEQGKDVFIVMNKALVNGLEGQRIYDRARKQGVRFLRTSRKSLPTFSRDKESIRVTVNETTLGRIPLRFECDLLVVPESVHPSNNNSTLAAVLGSDLDKEGFLQSANVRHRLISSPRKGIFFLGACHDETDEGDMDREMAEVFSLLNHIREQDPAAARIDENHCVRCLTCFRICPHRAVMLRDSLQPWIIPDACFGCGQCVSACPNHAIKMEKVPHEPPVDESDSKKTVVFACERSAALAEKEARRLGLGPLEDVRIVPVACAGSVSMETMLGPLLGEAERILVLGCHQGNCRSDSRGVLVSSQIKMAAKNIGLPEKALEYGSVAANEPAKFVRIVSE